jgi:hypothetical protein
MTGKMVLESVRRAREFEPESLTLPQITEGKVWRQTDMGMGNDSICFPNGRHTPADLHHWEKWRKLSDRVVSTEVIMAYVEAPILQSAANVVKSAITAFRTLPTNPADSPEDFKTALWFDEHTTVSGGSLRRAVHDGKFLRTIGSAAKKRYSLTDAKTIWGSDIVHDEA